MKFVRRKATANTKFTPADFARLKESFFNDVVVMVTMEEIPMEQILNWDQTGTKLVPSSDWTMDQQGVKWVKVCGEDDKRGVTAVFFGCIFHIGDILPLLVIYKGKTNRCHPKFEFSLGWQNYPCP